jgi:hypothetical protein
MQAWARLDSFKGCFQGRKGTVWILGGILLLAFMLRVCPLEDLTRGLTSSDMGTMIGAESPFFNLPRDQGRAYASKYPSAVGSGTPGALPRASVFG